MCFILHNLIVEFASDPKNLDDLTFKAYLEEAGVDVETDKITLGKSIEQAIIVNSTAEVIDEVTHRRLTQSLINYHMNRQEE